jgi:hypothetical protein
MPLSMIETLRDFVEKVDRIGIDYMVTGSFAMSAYGEIRHTKDIDIVIEIPPRLIEQFTRLFEPARYYISENSVRRAVDQRSMFNVVDKQYGDKIDFIIRKDTEFARESFSHRRKAVTAGVEFWTSTKEDLIIAKLDWAKESHSELQIRDIANLTVDAYDADYVADWVGRLCLTEIWAEVQKWKTLHLRSDN